MELQKSYRKGCILPPYFHGMILVRPVAVLFFCILLYVAGLAQRDTIIVKQGDRLIGDFQSLSKNIVHFSTGYSSGALLIKWSDILVLRSVTQFQLFDKAEHSYTGRIDIDTLYKKKLRLTTRDTSFLLDVSDITEMSIYKKPSLSDRLRLEANIGYTVAQQNNTHTGSLGANFNYQARRWNFTAGYEGFVTQVDSIGDKRGNLEGNGQYRLPNNWFVIGRAGLYYSSEQEITDRITLYWGGGNYLLRRANSSLYIDGGGTFNREKYSIAKEKFVSWESFTGLRYGYDLQKGIAILTELIVYPSLTQSGRIRTYSKADLGYNISAHFNMGVQYVMNTDSKPPVTSNKTDYIFSFRFGWHL